MMNVDDGARQERNLGFYLDLEPQLKIYLLKAIKNKVHLSGEVLDLKKVEQRMNNFIVKTISDGKNKTFQSDNQFICYMSKIVSSINNKIYKYSDLLLDENLYILEEIEHKLKFEEDANYHVKYIRWKARTLAQANPDFKAYNKGLMVKHLMNVLQNDFRSPATTRDWDADYGFEDYKKPVVFKNYTGKICAENINSFDESDCKKEILYDDGKNNTSETYLDFIRKMRSKSDSLKTLSA